MNYALNAGRLKKRVEIWKYQDVENEIGGTSTRLALVKTVYAEIRALRGKEYLEYHNENNSLEYKITTRYHADITPDCVLMFKGRQFEIQAVINIEETNGILEIMCTEKLDKDKQVMS